MNSFQRSMADRVGSFQTQFVFSSAFGTEQHRRLLQYNVQQAWYDVRIGSEPHSKCAVSCRAFMAARNPTARVEGFCTENYPEKRSQAAFSISAGRNSIRQNLVIYVADVEIRVHEPIRYAKALTILP